MYFFAEAFQLTSTFIAWRALMRHAMKVDVSWNASAKKYIELYQNLMEK